MIYFLTTLPHTSFEWSVLTLKNLDWQSSRLPKTFLTAKVLGSQGRPKFPSTAVTAVESNSWCHVCWGSIELFGQCCWKISRAQKREVKFHGICHFISTPLPTFVLDDKCSQWLRQGRWEDGINSGRQTMNTNPRTLSNFFYEELRTWFKMTGGIPHFPHTQHCTDRLKA